MSEHTRRSPYEPEHNDGSERNSRQEPPEHEVHTGGDDAPEPTAEVASDAESGEATEE